MDLDALSQGLHTEIANLVKQPRLNVVQMTLGKFWVRTSNSGSSEE